MNYSGHREGERDAEKEFQRLLSVRAGSSDDPLAGFFETL
jgi:hypothetical protein